MFDVIVIGVGSMGSSASYFLASRGYKVLGLEQFEIPHDQGSYTGQSRIIRKAYFEHPDYVPLLNTAYENWKNIEWETGRQVYYRTGLAYFGHPESEMMEGVNLSAALHAIPIEHLNATSASKRFPQFTIPPEFECLFEPDAGFIKPEEAVLLYKEQAIRKGAEIRTNEKVIEWKKEGTGIVVVTDKDRYRCDKLVITSGAWSGKLVPGFADKIKVTRQSLAWVQPNKENDFTINTFPCWMIADNNKPGCYYGFPLLPVSEFGGPGGTKMAYHYPGIVTDPDNVNREPILSDRENLGYLLDKYFAGSFGSTVSFKTCLYANSPDENFIIDKLPAFEDQVTIACGFSGHGFKFTSVVGEILADLTIEGTTKHPIGFLSAKRLG